MEIESIFVVLVLNGTEGVFMRSIRIQIIFRHQTFDLTPSVPPLPRAFPLQTLGQRRVGLEVDSRRTGIIGMIETSIIKYNIIYGNIKNQCNKLSTLVFF